MKMLLPTLLLTAACGSLPTPMLDAQGRPIYRPIAVQAELRADWDALAAETNALAGYEMLAIDARGQGFVSYNPEECAKTEDNLGHEILGYAQGRNVTMDKMQPNEQGWQKLTLAHEIGHAMGLDHSETGLMRANMSVRQVGREAEFLVKALQQAGLL